jgi:hypothetical protein
MVAHPCRRGNFRTSTASGRRLQRLGADDATALFFAAADLLWSASEQGWPNRVEDLTALAASSALAGRMDKARAAMAYIGERNPTLSVSTLKVLVRRPEDFARWADGLRMAGLPE